MRPSVVFGAAGFVGRHLARYLEAQGREVIRVTRDVPRPLPRLLGPAYYCVGMTRDFSADPAQTVDAHCGLLAVLTRDHDLEGLVYLSSTRLYDGRTRGEEDDVLPLDPRDPRHLYDLSKALGESLTIAAGGRVARLANVYASELDAPLFIHEAVLAAQEGRGTPVARYADAARDYVHVDDVCAALRSLAEEDGPQTVNVASGRNISNRQLFDLLEARTGHRLVAEVEAGAPEAPLISTVRLREAGVMPRTLEQALEDMIGYCMPAERRVA